MRGLGQSRDRQRGQSLLEFALVMPLAVLLLIAVFDVGRAVYGTSAVGNASRMGGRTAVVNQTGTDIRQRAADQATALGITAGVVACDASNVPTTSSGTCIQFKTADLTGDCTLLSVGCIAVVTTKWTFTPITPLLGQFIGNVALTSTTEIPIESVCNTAYPACPKP
jgi:Flp pilus assembly protein TadG